MSPVQKIAHWKILWEAGAMMASASRERMLIIAQKIVPLLILNAEIRFVIPEKPEKHALLIVKLKVLAMVVPVLQAQTAGISKDVTAENVYLWNALLITSVRDAADVLTINA